MVYDGLLWGVSLESHWQINNSTEETATIPVTTTEGMAAFRTRLEVDQSQFTAFPS